jgi:predicted NBD/HSP70 family sugar kinase
VSPGKRYGHGTLRTSNRALLFDAIVAGGEASRFDLAKKTGISPATVGTIVDDLISEGLFREIRVGVSTGGRPPVLVDVDAEGRFAVAGSLTVRGASFSLVDLRGTIRSSIEVERVYSGNEAAEFLVREVLGALLAGMGGGQPIDPARIAGCAINVPGMVRSSDGLILYSPPLRLSYFDLPAILESLVPAPASVYKDTDALLLAESQVGEARQVDDAVYVWVKAGVGMSYLHDGELLVLPRGGFELGHTAWLRGGPPCHCGNSGCIGTELSEAHAVGLYRQRGGIAKGGVDYEGLCTLAAGGDEAAIGVLSEQAEGLGATIANVVNLLNPILVVVGGPLRGAPPGIHEKIRAIVRLRVLDPFKAEARVEFSHLSRDEVHAAMAGEVFRKRLFPLP